MDGVTVTQTPSPAPAPLPVAPEQPYFTMIDSAADFDAQMAACEARNATLASIHSEAEFTAAHSACTSVCYIGLRRPPGSSTRADWTWVDGSAVDYTNWLGEEGKATGENTAALRVQDTEGWHDWGSGATALRAICRHVRDYAEWAGGWHVEYPDGFSSIYRIAADGAVTGSHCGNDDGASTAIKRHPYVYANGTRWYTRELIHTCFICTLTH